MGHLRKWSPHTWFSTLNQQGYSFRTYKHACFDVLKKSLTTVILLTINSVSEPANNCYNFSIHVYSLPLGSTSQTLSSFLIQALAWYVECWVDDDLLYSFSISSKKVRFSTYILFIWCWPCYLYHRKTPNLYFLITDVPQSNNSKDCEGNLWYTSIRLLLVFCVILLYPYFWSTPMAKYFTGFFRIPLTTFLRCPEVSGGVWRVKDLSWNFDR